ncbi:MAG: radical SAM protein [Pelagibacterales bacterium]|nr:radical SAM protein [Pelagibacterales bacterium]
MEGEKSCGNIVKRILKSKGDKSKIFENEIDGCVFIHPETKNTNNIKLVRGKYLERIKDLDEIPSPYLKGMLDKFFDGKLTPFIETNRGCPFTCSFCHTGNDYFHKLNKFSEQRVKDEIDYIGKKAGALGITNLHFADVNFGMYPQDRMTCEFLVESKKKYGWPHQVMATTGKNSKKRVMEITNILGNMFAINMSLQSMDEQVLKNIKRSNIKLDHMIEVNDHLRNQGRSTKAELIMTLPGENKETFIKGLNNVLNSNATSVTIYTLMMLHGTQFKNPSYRKQFNYKGKYRIVPLNFGEYDGEKIFDYEEVGIESKDLPFEDYIYLRALALLVEGLHNGRPFNEFFLYAKLFNIQPATLLKMLYDNIKDSSEHIQKIMNEFTSETKGELWDSEKELLNHYRKEENYNKLKNGEVGGNLIYKYKSKGLVEAGSEWIDYFERQVYKAVINKHNNISNLEIIKSEIKEIANFCRAKIHGLLNPEMAPTPINQSFNYDILKWIDEYNGSKRLKDFKFTDKQSLVFEYTSDQVRVRNDVFKRYGTDINALSKIVTRISNLEGQFRKVRHSNDNYLRDIYKKVG